MNVTTIKLQGETKAQLDKLREYKNESYDELINKIIYIVKNIKKQPELSLEAVEAIESARKRIKSSSYIMEEEAKKRLGF